MIGLAEAEEARRPLGVEYRVRDVRSLEAPGEFDLAFAAYLLNYAHTAEELTQMCEAVARALRPGGRFVTANNNPAEPPAAFPAGRAYGFSRRVEGELVEGAPIVWEIFLPEGSFEVTNYYLGVGTMDEAFRAAGLREVRWHAPEVSPEGCASSAGGTGRTSSPARRWPSSSASSRSPAGAGDARGPARPAGRGDPLSPARAGWTGSRPVRAAMP
jgi:hypothetical protein